MGNRKTRKPANPYYFAWGVKRSLDAGLVDPKQEEILKQFFEERSPSAVQQAENKRQNAAAAAKELQAAENRRNILQAYDKLKAEHPEAFDPAKPWKKVIIVRWIKKKTGFSARTISKAIPKRRERAARTI